MQFLKQLLQFLIIASGTTALYSIASQLAPFPFNRLDIIFLSIICWMLFGGNTVALLALCIPCALNEYVSAWPFGTTTISLIISVTIVHWLLGHLVTNHPLFRLSAAGGVGIISYRLLTWVINLDINGGHSGSTLSLELIYDILWQALVTTLVLGLVYVLSRRFIRRLQPQYLENFNSHQV